MCRPFAGIGTRTPPEEVAKEMGMSEDKVRDRENLPEPVSLETPVGKEDSHLGISHPMKTLRLLQKQLPLHPERTADRCLDTLTPRRESVETSFWP